MALSAQAEFLARWLVFRLPQVGFLLSLVVRLVPPVAVRVLRQRLVPERL